MTEVKMAVDRTNVKQALATLRQDPPLCADSAIFEIKNNGDWLYQGGALPIKFCTLFASILNRIEGEYYLITPVEKLKVVVASEALVIIDYNVDAKGGFTVKSSINTHHYIESFSLFTVTEANINVMTDRGVMAKLNRACFYRFINEFIA
ncbi:DUF1285 domain-containing protein [Shewanella youngdeokensis]|uniref:DUF1285 domain-containing protein n=1 Tax=Shewanella youngdeokensis TaxID=2999068 RepID=A0ABZ0K235_9GAMM|nr:DUF1285 domain-containing protein [Shewanella sp. DAU334]